MHENQCYANRNRLGSEGLVYLIALRVSELEVGCRGDGQPASASVPANRNAAGRFFMVVEEPILKIALTASSAIFFDTGHLDWSLIVQCS